MTKPARKLSLPTLAAAIAGLVAGLAYGMLYRRTGNLRACVVSHCTTNLTIAGWVLATRTWSLW